MWKDCCHSVSFIVAAGSLEVYCIRSPCSAILTSQPDPVPFRVSANLENVSALWQIKAARAEKSEPVFYLAHLLNDILLSVW